MGEAGGLKPFVAVDFVVTDDGADTGGEDFSAAAGHGVDTSIAELDEGLLDGELGAAGEEGHLDHCEGLDVDLGEAFL